MEEPYLQNGSRSRKLLSLSTLSLGSSPTAAPPPPPPPQEPPIIGRVSSGGGSEAAAASSLDYDVVVILAAMICALVCALGLNSMLQCVVRCTRRALTEPVGWVHHRRLNAGLKREDVVALPVATYAASPPPQPAAGESSPPPPPGCAICLSDFADGEKIRVLPTCSHRFHVACIDTWLLSHCSCPTCRRRLSSLGAADAP